MLKNTLEKYDSLIFIFEKLFLFELLHNTY